MLPRRIVLVRHAQSKGTALLGPAGALRCTVLRWSARRLGRSACGRLLAVRWPTQRPMPLLSCVNIFLFVFLAGNVDPFFYQHTPDPHVPLVVAGSVGRGGQERRLIELMAASPDSPPSLAPATAATQALGACVPGAQSPRLPPPPPPPPT